MKFQVEETVTKADWMACLEANTNWPVRAGIRGTNALLQLTGGFFVVFGGLLALLSLLSGSVNLLTLIGGACVWGGVLTFRKYRNAGIYDSFSNRVNISDTPMRFSFEEDIFFVWEGGKSSSYRYHTVSDLQEDREHFYLFLDGKMHFILRKDAFVQGQPKAFSAFLSEKVGKPLKYIEKD